MLEYEVLDACLKLLRDMFMLKPGETIAITTDTMSSDEIVELLRKSNRDYKQTIIMITHNMEIAKSADRIIKIEDGKIVGEV